MAVILCASQLLMATSTFSAPDDCSPTLRKIQMPTTQPARCLAVRLQTATLVLDLSLTRAHAYGTTMTHTSDDRLSHWYMRLANELLQAAPAAAASADCAQLDGESLGWGNWLHYIALQMDAARVVVYATGSDTPATELVVRDSSSCNRAMGTRVYTLPGGRIILPLVTSIS